MYLTCSCFCGSVEEHTEGGPLDELLPGVVWPAGLLLAPLLACLASSVLDAGGGGGGGAFSVCGDTLPRSRGRAVGAHDFPMQIFMFRLSRIT